MQCSNRLLPYLGAYFESLLMFQTKPADYRDAVAIEAFRDQIKSAFKQFERLACEHGGLSEWIYHTKYALTALVDEWVIRTLAEHSSSWMAYPLQLELFGETSAGERFFTQLSELRMQGEACIDLLELYYIALELGYEGQFRLTDQSKRLQLKNALFSQIQNIRKMNDFKLSETNVVTLPVADRFTNRWFRKAGLFLFVGIGVTALVLMGAIRYQAHQDRRVILQYHQQLTRSVWP